MTLCHEFNYMWWGNEYLELHEWEYFRKLKKTRILDIIMLFPNRNPQKYKEHVISYIAFAFAFGEGGTIIHWLQT